MQRDEGIIDTALSEMTIVVLGHVDHGKSTLVGRLLYDTGQVQADRVDFARRRSQEQGRDLEFAFLLDGLAEEQEQGITIEFTQTRMQIEDRTFVIADAPGHREFLKNMLSGASRAEAALLVIDATEGVQEQSRRHGYLLALLGIKQLAVVVNKMDLVDWSELVFSEIRTEYEEFLALSGLQDVCFIPAAAYTGDNLLRRSSQLNWYEGPTVLEQFLAFQPEMDQGEVLRLMVQDVYRFSSRRMLVGRINSGCMAVGQEVMLWPTLEQTRIKHIECWPKPETITAGQGQCVAVELSDPLFAERGTLLTGLSAPPISSRGFQARVVWLGRTPLAVGQRYKLKIGFQEIGARFERFDRVIDIGNLQEAGLRHVPAGFVGEGLLVADQPVVFDLFCSIPETGRFVLIDGGQIAGGGIVLATADPVAWQVAAGFSRDRTDRTQNLLFPENSRIGKVERRQKNKCHSLVMWLTGLSGAGKSTLARGLEERLFREGLPVYVLDGDNIRGGLNKDLDFSAAGRRENIRRVGETAKLFVDAGLIVITAFISPYEADRGRVRALLGQDEFVEVYVRCSLTECEKRDTKGLYAQARQGIVRQFTGVDDIYEEPQQPDIVIDTERFSVEECVEQLYQFLKPAMDLPV